MAEASLGSLSVQLYPLITETAKRGAHRRIFVGGDYSRSPDYKPDVAWAAKRLAYTLAVQKLLDDEAAEVAATLAEAQELAERKAKAAEDAKYEALGKAAFDAFQKNRPDGTARTWDQAALPQGWIAAAKAVLDAQ